RAPVAEDHRCEGDEPAAARDLGDERPVSLRAEREIDAAAGGEEPREDDAAVPDEVDVDADGVRRPRVLAARADAQPDRRLEEHDVRADHKHERSPGEDGTVAP